MVSESEHSLFDWRCGLLRRWIACTLPLVLAGCGDDYCIRLATAHEALPSPRFIVSSKEEPGEKRISYQRVRVERKGGDNVCYISRADGVFSDSPCQITYGQDLPSFERKTLEPLREKTSYDMVVGGPGEMIGVFDFRVDASGTLHAE